MFDESKDSLGDIGIYVHIPYCIKKCPYCDFNSYAVGVGVDSITEQRYVQALCLELEHASNEHRWSGRGCRSVFYGGGTPSLFHVESIERIQQAIARYFPLRANAEVTCEANPGTIQEQLGREKLAGFRQAGINRISMGVQSFRKEKLSFLGRLHSGTDVRKGVESIRTAGFENFNLDLIFGAGNETLEEWRADLVSAIELRPKHLSCYSLTIEAGTEFGKLQRSGKLAPPSDDLQADMFEYTQRLCQENGYEQYEISNYAQSRAECVHNLGYWRAEDYLGVGAGAHSSVFAPDRSSGERWSNLPGPSHYIEAIEKTASARQRRDFLNSEQIKSEFFYLGLRTRFGISASEFRARFHSEIPNAVLDCLRRYQSQALVRMENDVISLTPKGLLFADGIFLEIAEHLESAMNEGSNSNVYNLDAVSDSASQKRERTREAKEIF